MTLESRVTDETPHETETGCMMIQGKAKLRNLFLYLPVALSLLVWYGIGCLSQAIIMESLARERSSTFKEVHRREKWT